MTAGAPSRGCLATKTAAEIARAPAGRSEARVRRLLEDLATLIRDAQHTDRAAAARAKARRGHQTSWSPLRGDLRSWARLPGSPAPLENMSEQFVRTRNCRKPSVAAAPDRAGPAAQELIKEGQQRAIRRHRRLQTAPRYGHPRSQPPSPPRKSTRQKSVTMPALPRSGNPAGETSGYRLLNWSVVKRTKSARVEPEEHRDMAPSGSVLHCRRSAHQMRGVRGQFRRDDQHLLRSRLAPFVGVLHHVRESGPDSAARPAA